MAPTELRPPARALRLALCVLVGLAVALAPAPEGVDPRGWNLLGIFAGAIAGLLLQPFAMAPVVIFALVTAIATGTLSTGEALAGYGEPVVWLVVGAFLLAGALRDTGLGRRIALTLVAWLGRSTLGLGYAQAAAELVLGPVVPSNTARGGGILAPIGASLASALDSEPHVSPERAGRYLTLVGAHANLVSAAMFLTGMAANPLLAAAAQKAYGIEFTWTDWALAMIVPGLLAMLLLPAFLYWIARPTVRDGRPAQARARAELAALGPWSREQRVMGLVFVLMLALWTTKPLHGLDTTSVAWIGVAVLILAGAQPWQRMAGDAATWDALIWLGGLLTLAESLRHLGIVAWFVDEVGLLVDGLAVLPTALALAVVYFYSMYGFSMMTAHITAMAGAFLAVCAAADVPALLAVPLFACFSNLCGATTNYSTGPVIIWFGLGYVPSSMWFRVGFLVSLFHLALWLPVGLLWWRFLGWW